MPRDDQPAVLYVDDEPANLRVFEANFRGRFNLILRGSGAEALELFAERPHQIGVLVSDQRMPDMSGVQLLEQVRGFAPETARMIITAYSDLQAVLSAVNRGQVSRYFIKPWVREELVNAFEDALRIFSLQGRLRDIEVRLLHSERLAALGQVSAGIAHELMNPVAYVTQNVAHLQAGLRTVESYLRAALAERPSEEVGAVLEDLPGMLGDLEKGARHIREVALNVRSQARGEDLEQSCELAELVPFAVKLCSVEVSRRARVSLSGSPARVALGPVKLTQVLLNLLVNAAQAIPPERTGLIEICWREEDEKTLRLQVRDDGQGIPPELREKVFEPLFTTKPTGVGTGLGLAICRELVRSAGGEIRLQSQLGEGTTVELFLLKG